MGAIITFFVALLILCVIIGRKVKMMRQGLALAHHGGSRRHAMRQLGVHAKNRGKEFLKWLLIWGIKLWLKGTRFLTNKVKKVFGPTITGNATVSQFLRTVSEYKRRIDWEHHKKHGRPTTEEFHVPAEVVIPESPTPEASQDREI